MSKPKGTMPTAVIDPLEIQSQIVTAKKTIDRGISGIIYADPGIGKTTLATTLPVDETLIINTEAGLGPTLGTGHSIFNLKSDLTQVENLYKYLRTQKHPFKYVVIDNISEFQDWYINKLVEYREKQFPAIGEYGDAAYKLHETLHNFRDLVDLNICVIFNAWEQLLTVENKTDGEVHNKICPKLMKSITFPVCGMVDFVGRLEKYDKTGDRWVRFHPSKNLFAKCQFSGLAECEPANLPEIFEKLYTYDYSKKAA